MKIALLSNVNMNPVIRLLGEEAEVYQGEGYGNELGALLNPASSYHAFDPEITFLVMDLMELLGHELDASEAGKRVEAWFSDFEGGLGTDCIYYVSDAWLWGPELSVVQDPMRRRILEGAWLQRLRYCMGNHANVRVFPYAELIGRLGEERAFSLKMWYMGRILLSREAQKLLHESIMEYVLRESETPRKVLLLDLDNTLWGGLAGENDHEPVKLSEEHTGLAYKNLQRVILQMQRQGVLLGIVSKNNEADAERILASHPHMTLSPECFAARRINWKPKHENIRELARELNLGLDSFVFFDDNPAERSLVRETLPQVAVPEFPDKPEDLAPAMAEIYRRYFAKPVLTEEDLGKTAQYAAIAKRREFKREAGSFEEYLQGLQITLERVEPGEHLDRLTQLVNKTNQFNLTALRYTRSELKRMLEEETYRFYLYRSGDRFGDNGIVAALILSLERGTPRVEEFVMSCRVMGRWIERAVLDEVERDMKAAGYERLRGIYLPTGRNMPVEGLYKELGYAVAEELPDGGIAYELEIAKAPERVYYVERG